MTRGARCGGMADRSTSVAFVGLLDVEGRGAENPAYSPAGTHFQESLLSAMRGTDVEVTHVYALRPTPSFPRHSKLFYGARFVMILGNLPTTLLGFVNGGPLKTLSSGLALLPRLLTWAWRERRRKRAILTYNVHSPPGIVSVVAARLTRSRVVAIVADLQVPGDGLLPNTLLRRIDFWLQRRSLSQFDGLVVLTRRMAEDFAPAVPWLQMEGAASDPVLDVPVTSVKHEAANASCFVLMYSGGLSALKGVDNLLEAFARVDGDYYRLWITGVGPLSDMVRQASTRDGRITYWGFVEEDELRSLYGSADVLVNPHSVRHASARYLFPSKLIEYLATGTPVISTCSTPEIAEEYSHVLFASSDDSPGALADAIRCVAHLPQAQRRAIGEAARRFVLESKSWRHQAQRVAAFVSHGQGDS